MTPPKIVIDAFVAKVRVPLIVPLASDTEPTTVNDEVAPKLAIVIVPLKLTARVQLFESV